MADSKCDCEVFHPGPKDDKLGQQCIICSIWVKEAKEIPTVYPWGPYHIPI